LGGQPRLGQVDLFDLADHLGQGHLSAPDLTQVAQLGHGHRKGDPAGGEELDALEASRRECIANLVS